MRISNNMISYNFLNSLNKAQERMNTLQEQLADGKAVHRPSDDPIKAIRSLKFNTNLNSNEQFTQNLNDSISWMSTTDGELTNLGSVVMRAKELVIQSVSANPSMAFQAMGQEIDGLINAAIDIGNTKLGDRYIFSGQQDKTQPYTRAIGTDNITYSGDNSKISMPIQPGTVNPDQDSVNLTGLEVFGANNELLNHLVDIKNQLLSGAPDLNWMSKVALAQVDSDHDRVLSAQTQLGSRMSMYDMMQNLMQDEHTVINTDLSANEDLDIPKAIIDFKNNQNIYQSALSVGARIMPPSLVDFLK